MREIFNSIKIIILSLIFFLSYNCNNNSSMKKIIKTNEAPEPIGPYNQAIEAGEFIFLSGQIGIDVDTGELINENIQAETNQVMRNIESVLKASNRNFDNVVKSTIFLKDLNDFSIVNEVYSKYFKNKISPARETVEVARLPKDANVEISVIAY
jgi:2-iminobutanoate/2-iminopropanoate deaminase